MYQESEILYSSDQDLNNGLSSEKVQAMANSVYGEFKRMMAMYGEDVIKELMPLIVTILETLDRSLSECNANSVEVELLKDDNEQLATQYERERQLRRQAEQQLMESEDINEAATREVRAKADTLETATRLLELKCKNYTDQVERLQEREAELKREYTVLHERHTEMIQSYMEHIEKTKVLQQQSSFSELSQSPNNRIQKHHNISISITPSSPSSPDDKSQLTSSEEHHPAEVMEEIKTETKPNNSQMDIGKSSLEHVKSQSSTPEVYSSQIKPSETDSSRENTKSHSVAKLAEAHLLSASNINTNVSVDRSQATVKGLLFKVCFTRIWSDQIESLICRSNSSEPSTGIENVAFETNESSLYAELSKHDLGDVDEGADILGMSKEVENLLHENTKLLATKNALNVVKDDLIQQVDQLTTQHTILKEELETSEKAKQKLQVRMGEFEQQLAQLQHELENVGKDGMRNSVSKQSDEDDAVPLSQRKRFTRVEMARVLMERNQYKERLMELQEAVRWTETLRASRNHPEVPQPKIKSKSNIFNFFSRLFTSNSSENAAPSPQPPQLNVSMAYNAPSSKVMPRSKSTSMSLYGRSPTIDTLREEYQTRMNDNSRIQVTYEQIAYVKSHLIACGWSLPNSPASPKEGSRTVPVPVYCGPMVDSNANMKVWCATAVNMAVGRTRDGGSIIATSSIFYEGKELGTLDVCGTSLLCSLQELENQTQTIKQDEKRREALSSLVWIVSGDTRSGNGAHGGSKVRVMDAQEPNKCIEEFIIGNNDTHVLCMASVPGALEEDYSMSDSLEADSMYSSAGIPTSDRKYNINTNQFILIENLLAGRVITGVLMLGMTQSPTDVDPPSTRTQEDGVEATEDLVSSDPTNLPKSPTQGTTSNLSESPKMVKTPTGEKGEFPPSDQNGGGDMAPSKDDNPPSSTDDMKLASVQPTVWMGAQNGCVYVHSAISHWGRCLHQIRLKDSVLSIVHLKGRVLAALADGTVAIFRRDTDGVWDLSSYYLLDLGRPHHSIRCMSVVYDHVWCGYRNRIHIVEPKSMKVVKSFDAHPRRESQVRQLAWGGDGVWVSIRLDSTVRLYHARTLQHLQDVDIEPYVSKVLGSGKLGFSFVRITALMISQNRLWIGTGNGVVMSVPLSEVLSSSARGAERPGGVVRVYKDPLSDKITPGTFIPYCSMANAQLSFHGYRDAVKFFVAVPGSVLLKELGLIATINTHNANDPGGVSPPKSHPNNGTLVLSGGDGYVDFRKGDLVAFSPEETRSSNAGMQSTTQMSHVIVWQLTHQ
uniref:RH1 domain-containing protein n=1 Tax=Ciona savignyi TaxID=51511 RepID=H2ZKT9_CIOSA